jgi:D-sedoheptulose 7-phosphate isomerase
MAFGGSMDQIKQIINESIILHRALLNDALILSIINRICSELIEAFQKGNKVLLCGNGGSAADAQHIAAELSGKFYLDRKPLYAEALHVNTSYLTAVANDYSFQDVFARLVMANGKPGDILIAISTSGNSMNVVKAIKMARQTQMVTVGLTGGGGGKVLKMCDYPICVPSTSTPRIQEIHIMIGHIICELVEARLFRRKG